MGKFPATENFVLKRYDVKLPNNSINIQQTSVGNKRNQRQASWSRCATHFKMRYTANYREVY